MSLQSDILAAFEKVTAKEGALSHAWVRPYEAPKEADVRLFLDVPIFPFLWKISPPVYFVLHLCMYDAQSVLMISPAIVQIHQFIFFLKPEVTSTTSGVDTAKVLEVALKALSDFNVDVGAVRVLSGEYLDKHDLMVQVNTRSPFLKSSQFDNDVKEKMQW